MAENEENKKVGNSTGGNVDFKVEKKFGVKEPNEGVNGKVASNMTGEAITGNYDYGNITDEDKIVVGEIIDLLRGRAGVPVEMIVEEIKTKFQLVEIPMKKVEDSVWGQLTKDERLGQTVQGFRTSYDENKKQIRIPHVGFSADLDYLDEFVNRLIQKANKIKAK
tara:strand:- start:324 stop:818 length:495 start_codon:yes stop_codon:yes gene_type:complete